MSTNLKKVKSTKSITFIVCVSISFLCFCLFLYCVISMGYRYNYFREQLSSYELDSSSFIVAKEPITQEIINEIKSKFLEPEVVWNIFLKSKSELISGYQYSDIYTVRLPFELWTKFTKVNMNLGFTISTIVFLFAFVISGFIPLSYWIGQLSKKKQKKAKQIKEKKNIQKLSIGV